MKECPQCGVWMFEVDPRNETEKCYNCGFERKIENIKEYYFREDVTYKLFSVKSVEPEKAFRFYLSSEVFTGERATSLEEFAKRIRLIDIKSLKFHLARRDFERWIVNVFGDRQLAGEISELSKKKPIEPKLRDELYNIILARTRR